MRNSFPLTFGIAAAFVLATPLCSAQAAGLSIGDSAPAITVTSFVKGKPVTKLGDGKISVVEFWATWCGPCIQSIPHVTELAKKYPNVQFVGVSVWETDQKQVMPFVTKMGDKMNYSVAMDRVAPGVKGSDGVMAKTWMTAAGQNGIPTAFIVGKDGRIAWIGHPMEMAEPLAKVTAGTWDIAQASATFKKEQAANEKVMAVSKKLGAAKTPKETVAILDQEFAASPDLEISLGTLKFVSLRRAGELDTALAYGVHLVDAVYKDNADALNSFAWGIVDPRFHAITTPELAQLGLKAAVKADTLNSQKDAATADTLAAAYFAVGDTAKALKTEERAVALARGTALEKDPSLVASLERYRTAATAQK